MRRPAEGEDDVIPLEVVGETEDLDSGRSLNPAPAMSRDYCGKCRIRFGYSEKRGKDGNHVICP